MAQKINPTSFRLGINQIWDSSLQTYGRSLNFYSLNIHKFLQIHDILSKFFLLHDFLFISEEIKINKSKFLLNIYYSYLPKFKKVGNYNFFKKIIKITSQWFKLNVCIRFYFKLSETPTTNLLVAYTKILLDQNVSSKKILWNLCRLLEFYMNSYKLSYSKIGFKKIYLKGFKICLSGRFDGSKNQMAKTFKQTTGSLSLSCLKSYVEYKKEEIYTRSGVCGIQIWLFYELS